MKGRDFSPAAICPDFRRLCNSRPPAEPTHGGMKPVSTNAHADLLTCYPREARANLLNLFEKLRIPFHSNRPTGNVAGRLFLVRARLHNLRKNSTEEARSVRARLQSCRKCQRINVGFSPCGMVFFIFGLKFEFSAACNAHPFCWLRCTGSSPYPSYLTVPVPFDHH